MTLRGTRALACAACAFVFSHASPMKAAEIPVPILYLHQEVEQPPVLSNLDPVPEDLGMAGAETALKDNKTTGGFLGHQYSLDIISVPPGGDYAAASHEALAKSKLILVDAPAAQLLAFADMPEAEGALVFNVSAEDAALRSQDCRANMLHTATEMAQRTDALMQVLQAKQWRKLAMIVGPKEPDKAYAAALRTSAAKFGLELLAEKEWTFDTDLRESTMQEIPRFTQDFPDHDVLLIADETDDFGRYVEHNTWLPRPVAGSDGMVATAWSHVIEAWGAVQLQNRFEDKHGRPMRGRDYAAWVAVRAIGEAVTRTNSANPQALRAHLLKPDYQQDGFKGRGLSFRAFNGQLRQPVAVVNSRALVTLAPFEGFLHPVSEMDTLGLDAPESQCKAFGG